MLLAPALEGSVRVILDCSGVRSRGTAAGIQINQEAKLPPSRMQPLPPTVLHHCWCQTVNLQAQHFTKPLEHQLSLSHATSAPQKSQLSLPGSPRSCPSQARIQNHPNIYFKQVQSSITPVQHDAGSAEITLEEGVDAVRALICALCLLGEAIFNQQR